MTPARPVLPGGPGPAAAPWRDGWESARALLRPGVFLQAAAVALVVAYYGAPATRPAFDRLAAGKTAGGYAFSAGASALCGGLLPFLYLQLAPATRRPRAAVQLGFLCLYWAWKGAEVDLWYRLLGYMFGPGNTLGEVAPKVLCDQLIYNPCYATPLGSLLFAWNDAGFRAGPVAADLRVGRWYARRVVPQLIAVWALWLPVVCCVFALPPPLQVPLFSLVLCFWSMLYSSITRRQNRPHPAPGGS